MKIRFFNGTTALAGALLLAGCASAPKGSGFKDVQQTIAQRTSHKIQWPQNDEAYLKIQRAVDKLLQKKLTADVAVQIALLSNRNLQATYENLGIARADLVKAGLIPNPIFSGDIKFDLTGGAATTELSIAQNFLSALFIPIRKKIAAARFKQTKLQVSAAVLSLAGQTRRTFYTLEAQKQLATMYQKAVDITRSGYAMAKRLHQAGNIPKLDVNQQQALYNQTKLALASAQTQITRLRQQLNRLMGLWGTQTQWQIAERLPAPPRQPLDLKNLEQRAISASLNLAQARQNVEALGQKIGISGLAGIFAEQMSVGADAENDPGEGWSVGPSLSLPIPLFNLGQPDLDKAKANVRQAFDAYSALAVNIRSQARTLRAQLLTDRRQALYYHKHILPLQAQITRRSQLQYNAMQISVFQLLEAKRQQIRARRQSVAARGDYWITRSKMSQLLAGSMPAPDALAPTLAEAPTLN